MLTTGLAAAGTNFPQHTGVSANWCRCSKVIDLQYIEFIGLWAKFAKKFTETPPYRQNNYKIIHVLQLDSYQFSFLGYEIFTKGGGVQTRRDAVRRPLRHGVEEENHESEHKCCSVTPDGFCPGQ